MKVTGHCYCGGLAFEAEGEPIFRAQCHCRECQYTTGGGPNMVMAMPEDGFRWTRGEASSYTRPDLEGAVTRMFCPSCGNQLATRSPGLPGGVILRVGTFDDPSVYEGPQMAIFLCDAQPWQTVPEGVPTFERFPG
jgi:hypothetical protein